MPAFKCENTTLLTNNQNNAAGEQKKLNLIQSYKLEGKSLSVPLFRIIKPTKNAEIKEQSSVKSPKKLVLNRKSLTLYNGNKQIIDEE